MKNIFKNYTLKYSYLAGIYVMACSQIFIWHFFNGYSLLDYFYNTRINYFFYILMVTIFIALFIYFYGYYTIGKIKQLTELSVFSKIILYCLPIYLILLIILLTLDINPYSYYFSALTDILLFITTFALLIIYFTISIISLMRNKFNFIKVISILSIVLLSIIVLFIFPNIYFREAYLISDTLIYFVYIPFNILISILFISQIVWMFLENKYMFGTKYNNEMY